MLVTGIMSRYAQENVGMHMKVIAGVQGDTQGACVHVCRYADMQGIHRGAWVHAGM